MVVKAEKRSSHYLMAVKAKQKSSHYLMVRTTCQQRDSLQRARIRRQMGGLRDTTVN